MYVVSQNSIRIFSKCLSSTQQFLISFSQALAVFVREPEAVQIGEQG